MTLQDLLLLMQSGNMDKCIEVLETHCLVKSIGDALKQYDPKCHDVMDPTKRLDKNIYDENDKGETTIVDTVKVGRIPLGLQKKIVVTASAFLGLPQIEATTNNEVEDNIIEGINKTWDDNKLDYKFRGIAKTTMSQLECAELWFTKEADKDYWAGTKIKGKFKLSMLVLSFKKGDKLYPVFDEYGDMIAFGRGYKVKNADAKEDAHFDIYTADTIYYSKKTSDNAWLYFDPAIEGVDQYTSNLIGVPNVIGKIPIIYYYQPATEWNDVQPLIDRLEEILSNHADTNDYVGSPIVFAQDADEITFPKKGETGKLIQGKNGAKMSYLTYDAQPGSVKMEIENLTKYIYSLTHTPDISFENMQSLGYFSNIALQTLFLDAHNKAFDKEEIFGECIQRRINYLKYALASIDVKLKSALPMSIKPKFNYLIPQDYKEVIDTINAAVKGGIMSTETAIKQNPLVKDAKSEQELIDDENAAAPAPAPTIPIATGTSN